MPHRFTKYRPQDDNLLPKRKVLLKPALDSRGLSRILRYLSRELKERCIRDLHETVAIQLARSLKHTH
jgi:hypothetical protein